MQPEMRCGLHSPLFLVAYIGNTVDESIKAEGHSREEADGQFGEHRIWPIKE
jgi:hypothetical protein